MRDIDSLRVKTFAIKWLMIYQKLNKIKMKVQIKFKINKIKIKKLKLIKISFKSKAFLE